MFLLSAVARGGGCVCVFLPQNGDKEFDHRITLRGKHYFWMVGEFEDQEPVGSPDADHHLVDSGYVAIVPHRVDSTDYEELERLRDNWKLDG